LQLIGISLAVVYYYEYSKRSFAEVDSGVGDDNLDDNKNNLTMSEMSKLLNQSISRLDTVEQQLSTMQNEMSKLKESNLHLTKKNKTLEEKLYSQSMSINALGDSVEWKYSAPTPSLSYWQQLGFDEEYVENLNEYFIGHIECVTRRIRRGQCIDNIDIDIGNCESSELTVIDDDNLVLHWKELSDALSKDRSYNAEVSMTINHVQIRSEALDMLKQGLKYKQMYRLNLHGIQWQNNGEGVDFAVDKLQTKKIHEFGWAYSGTLTVSESTRLFQAVLYHPNLTNITLDDYIGMENGYDNLISLLTTKSKVSLPYYGSNNVRSEGDTRLSNFIATNPTTLRFLGLYDNELEDDDALMIATALRHNTNLSRIDLGSNNFTEHGLSAIRRSIYDLTSLNALSDCNHTCECNVIDFGEMKINWGSNQKDSRSKKLYTLLSDRNRAGTNIDSIQKGMEEDEVIQLLSDILACVQRYYRGYDRLFPTPQEFVPPLSIMFEMLRKLPEVHER